MTIYENENQQLVLQPKAEYFLDETRKWARFLAIMGFIFCGFMALLGVAFSFILDNIQQEVTVAFPKFIFIIIYLFLALIYFFPSLYLYRFAARAREALTSKNSSLLTGSLDSLRDSFRFMGIVFIVILVFYGIAFIIGLGSFLFFDMMSPDTFM